MSDHVERDAQIRRFEGAKRLVMENLAIQRQLADQRLADTERQARQARGCGIRAQRLVLAALAISDVRLADGARVEVAARLRQHLDLEASIGRYSHVSDRRGED